MGNWNPLANNKLISLMLFVIYYLDKCDVTACCVKLTQATFALVRRTCDRKWGLRPITVLWLYIREIRPFIFYGALVWWPKVTYKITKIKLGRIQRMACLAITGAMKSTPTASMEMLLNLTPPDLLIMAEAKMALYRLHILKQPADP